MLTLVMSLFTNRKKETCWIVWVEWLWEKSEWRNESGTSVVHENIYKYWMLCWIISILTLGIIRYWTNGNTWREMRNQGLDVCVCVCKYVFMSVYHIFLKNGNYWNILHVMVQWKGRVEDTGGSGKWNWNSWEYETG